MNRLIERFAIGRVRPHALAVLNECFGGIPHLCRALVCDLDFGLANEWHARLERPQTLAEGDYQCDFRWTPVSTEGTP